MNATYSLPRFGPVQSDSTAVNPFYVDSRYTTADFFAMFGATFRYGHGWSAADDEGKVHDVVIKDALNKRALSAANPSTSTLLS